MSRLTPHHAIHPIHQAARVRQKTSLPGDGSVLAGEATRCTDPLLDNLGQRLVQSLCAGDGDVQSNLIIQPSAAMPRRRSLMHWLVDERPAGPPEVTPPSWRTLAEERRTVVECHDDPRDPTVAVAETAAGKDG